MACVSECCWAQVSDIIQVLHKDTWTRNHMCPFVACSLPAGPTPILAANVQNYLPLKQERIEDLRLHLSGRTTFRFRLSFRHKWLISEQAFLPPPPAGGRDLRDLFKYRPLTNEREEKELFWTDSSAAAVACQVAQLTKSGSVNNSESN